MPKYDFQCEECGQVFEKLIAPHKTKEVKCLKCGSAKTQKVLSAPAIILKGAGFYKTDSQKNSSTQANSSKSTCSGSGCSSCKGCS